MRRENRHTPRSTAAAQQGFNLVELSVAMLVALFLLAGFLTVLQGTRKTSFSQTQLAQLQDDERVAMTILSNVVESAGYYPNPETANFSLELPVTGSFGVAGQAVSGTGTGPSTPITGLGDTMTIRYNAGATEDIIDCLGNTNAKGASEVVYVNTFQVLQPDPTQPPYLACNSSGNPNNTFVKLVNNVTNMSILYGVNTLATEDNTTNGAVDSYLPASSMTPDNWTNVYSVKVQLTFNNPLHSQPGQPAVPGQPATITFTKVIGLMSRVGVDVVNFK